MPTEMFLMVLGAALVHVAVVSIWFLGEQLSQTGILAIRSSASASPA
jgi:hypothetical protein